MEFRSIVPNCGTPHRLTRTEQLGLLRSLVEDALELADDLDLDMLGIDLDQALNRIDLDAREHNREKLA